MSVELRKKKLADGRQSYYLDIYDKGVRRYEFLQIYLIPGALDNKNMTKQAEMVRAQRLLQLNDERFGISTTPNKQLRFSAFAENYLKSYKKRDIRMVRCAVKKFEEFLDENGHPQSLRMHQLNEKLCEGFRNHLKDPKNGLGGETPQNYFARFKRLIQSAVKANVISKDPTDGLSIRRINEFHKEVLAQEEIQQLAQAECGNDMVKRAFLFSCFTGIGFAEAKEITAANFKGETFWYRRHKTGRTVHFSLHPSAKKLAHLEPGPPKPIFELPSSTAVNKCLQHWVNRAGLSHKKITFYSARHSFATNLLRNGVNLKTVADCMGHTTVQHTVKYLHYVDDLKDEAVKGLMLIG